MNWVYFEQIMVKSTQLEQNWVLFFRKWYTNGWMIVQKKLYREGQIFKVHLWDQRSCIGQPEVNLPTNVLWLPNFVKRTLDQSVAHLWDQRSCIGQPKVSSFAASETLLVLLFDITNNRPVSHSARHQRPARERHIMRIASRENVDNQAPRNTNFTQ